MDLRDKKHDGIFAEYISQEIAQNEKEIDLPDDINLSGLDMYGEDCTYSLYAEEDGRLWVCLSIKPQEGRWAGAQLYGKALIDLEADTLLCKVSTKSAEDLYNGEITEEEYEASIIERLDDTKLQENDLKESDFAFMYLQMQGLLMQNLQELQQMLTLEEQE